MHATFFISRGVNPEVLINLSLIFKHYGTKIMSYSIATAFIYVKILEVP